MGKTTGFLELDRQDRSYRDPKTRVSDYQEFALPLGESALRQQGKLVGVLVRPRLYLGFSAVRFVGIVHEWRAWAE